MAKDVIQAYFKLQRHQQSAFSLDVDLSIPAQGISAIYGSSGSGKTTLLRCIAGLEMAQEAQLSVNGQCWQAQGFNLPTHKRRLAYVFQEASLFDHLSVAGNLKFALKRSRQAKNPQLYQQVIALLGLSALLKHYPEQLSGGERQRVAIGRALLAQPDLLLMDEPLASLDQKRKNEVLPYLEQLHQEFKLAIIYVTHSMDEVARLADYLVLLEQGKVIEQGPLAQVLANPDSPLGPESGVVITAQLRHKDSEYGLNHFSFAGGELILVDNNEPLGASKRLRILAKDVSLSLQASSDCSIINRLQARVSAIHCNEQDAMALVQLCVGQQKILARITRRSLKQLDIQLQDIIWAQIKSVALIS